MNWGRVRVPFSPIDVLVRQCEDVVLRFPPEELPDPRLVDLVNTLDPKVVAAAFGMTAESVMIYLADHIDPGRLTEPPGRNP